MVAGYTVSRCAYHKIQKYINKLTTMTLPPGNHIWLYEMERG